MTEISVLLKRISLRQKRILSRLDDIEAALSTKIVSARAAVLQQVRAVTDSEGTYRNRHQEIKEKQLREVCNTDLGTYE